MVIHLRLTVVYTPNPSKIDGTVPQPPMTIQNDFVILAKYLNYWGLQEYRQEQHNRP